VQSSGLKMLNGQTVGKKSKVAFSFMRGM